MMVVDVYTSPGALDGAGRQRLGERLHERLMTEDSAPRSTMDGARAMTHVLVHEPAVWVTGGPDLADAPRYVVRLTVPGTWNNSGLAAHVIPTITDVVAEFESDPERLRREPHCVVQVVGLREQSLGTLGRVTDSTEITRLITAGFRNSGEQVAATAPGEAVDPVCGMTVDLATATLTLDHEGVRYAFCAPSCRKVFAEDLGITGAATPAGA